MRRLLSLALLLAALAAPLPARAERARQLDHDVVRAGDSVHLRIAFLDEDRARRVVEFDLPAAEVREDNQVPLAFPAQAAAKANCPAIRTYADRTKGPKIEATSSRSGAIAIRVSGRDRGKMQAALDGAKAAASAALDRYLLRHRYTRLASGGIVPDHARLAEEYADDVLPVADALAKDAPDARSFVARALAFVQAIPYEAGRGGADRGYRRPLSILARNKGDCDSKSALFLALVRAKHPELAASVVYVPNHAFAGVALEPEPGERTFRRDGVRYVGMEPVGPARFAPGRVSGKSGWHLFWGSAEARALVAPGAALEADPGAPLPE